jgi:His/Glu/Gln/Arg/opine family amino acid ABC transporter permease subunit
VLSVLIAVGGPSLIVSLGGLQLPELIATSLQSPALQLAAGSGIVLGFVALALGLGTYRSMSTHVAREQSIAGAILGAQGVAVCVICLIFVRGDMGTFARTFLNFPDVLEWRHYFLHGAIRTLVYAAVAAVGGILLGLLLAVFLISQRAIVRAPVRAYVNLVRGTPILVQLAIVYFGFALGFRINWGPEVALIVTIALNAGAYTAEVFRAGLQSIERGQLEAARGLGMNYRRALIYIIVPQATRRVIPPLMNDFINITKETSLVAFLGVSITGRELYSVGSQGYSQFFNSTFYVASALGYLAIILPLIALVNYTERRMRSGLREVGN